MKKKRLTYKGLRTKSDKSTPSSGRIAFRKASNTNELST
jgi:hypothetical protein